MARLDGFDAAHFQFDHGDPDLEVTLAAGLFWIAWKVSQSIKYVDPTFARIRSSWGRFRMRGMYHWLSSTTDVDQQAAHYLATVGVFYVGEFAMLDAEEKGITAAMCLRWCELVEAVTHRPAVIYTGLYVAGGSIWKSPELRMSQYGPRPFIVAAYVPEENLDARMVATGALPDFPRDAWQFDSDGPVPGIVGRCDMDEIDNVAAFELACEISHIVPTPGPVPIPGDDMSAIRLMIPTDDLNGAQFFAECFGGPDASGQPSVALSCRWTGSGGDPKVKASIAAHKGAGMTDYPCKVVDFANIALDGPLPPGWTADRFRNSREIESRMTTGTIDQIARDAAAHANAGVDGLDKRLDAASAALA